ncbi:DUF3987 domain-containing protein [Flavobacterium sp. DSR3-2]|uniref:DUF3987 domain-containing protein n=1 Tax=Flavobacterium sp. DSR3-2 TaxID=2804634 RepID=UPI003CF85F4F
MELKNINDIKNSIDNTVLTNKEIAKNQLEQIIASMPSPIKNIINDAFKHKRIPKEYLFSSILFAYSNAAGLAFSIDAMGYSNYSNLYFAIVGSRGDIKSPAMDLATQPLHDYDNTNYNEYKNNKIDDPSYETIRKQLFLQDATIESAQYVHYKNQYSIGIFIDELYNLVQKMANKNSNEGSAWRTFFLQGNTNKHIDISRKTTDSYRIDKSYPTLMGSIQTQFIPKLFADGNLESGLIDRFLFTYKLTSNDKLSTIKIADATLKRYSSSLLKLLNYRIDIETAYEMDCLTLSLDSDAQNRMFDYSQDLINKQSKLMDYSREYMAKMLINIHKLVLLVHLIENADTDDFRKPITVETLETAILVNEFYFTNFKIILEENISKTETEVTIDEIIKVAIKNNATQKDVVAITGKDKATISRHWNKVINAMQPAT